MVVILHNIRSLHNVGSIFRTADAVGAEKIYICGITPAPVDSFGKVRPQLAKVSLGAELSVSWERVRATGKLIDKLKKEKYKIFAVEQDPKSIPYYSVGRQVSGVKKIAVVLGNEVRGVPPAILKMADRILEIPMDGRMVRHTRHPKNNPERGRRKESLNVSVAAGVVLFRLRYPK